MSEGNTSEINRLNNLISQNNEKLQQYKSLAAIIEENCIPKLNKAKVISEEMYNGLYNNYQDSQNTSIFVQAKQIGENITGMKNKVSTVLEKIQWRIQELNQNLAFNKQQLQNAQQEEPPVAGATTQLQQY